MNCTRCSQYPCRCTGNVDVIAEHTRRVLADARLFEQAKEHLTVVPFGGRWPEVPTAPVEPGLKRFDVRYSVAIEATDEAAAIRLAGAIAEFMMGDCAAHGGESVAVVQSCSHSVGSPAQDPQA